MTKSTKPENKQAKNGAPELTEEPKQRRIYADITSDPEYQQLLNYYQQADFKNCQALLDTLENYYPENPVLHKFKDELELKLSVKNISASLAAGEKRLKRKATLRLAVFGLVGTLVVLIAFFLSTILLLGNIELPEFIDSATESEASQLNLYYQQAQQLLQLGQPQPAIEIIDKIKAIDPYYPSLAELTARSIKLLELEAQYQSALDLLEQNNSEEALEIFLGIETQMPDLWDVRKQISAIETAQKIELLIQDGDNAFKAGNWEEAIEAYESALQLDPRLENSLMKEQLLNSYLNQIISLLDREKVTLADIQVAEGFYRKAMAMIPQNRAYITERGNLQEVSSDLLFIKFTQIAKDNLEDVNQRSATISQAVTFLNKAADIKPDNEMVRQELQNAKYYQTGFQYFNNMNWIGAISNFEEIIAVDPNFANGNATILLFESYTAIARRYIASSIYPDALGFLEKAEFLVWGNGNSLANLFQTQVLIGDTLGQLGDYENAVSYYQYALNAIQTMAKVENYPAISTRLATADTFAANEDFENAFRAYQDVIKSIDVVYTILEIEVLGGTNLALFANINLSTLDLVLEANDLPRNMVITRGQTLLVPTIEY